jgi:glutamine phosphoribosylpyrophosphate amidotransferase
MCTISVCLGHPRASEQVYKMLYSTQHRGQEGVGIIKMLK